MASHVKGKAAVRVLKVGDPSL